MKIKMLQSIAGHAEPRYGLADFGFPPGAVIDVQDELAQAWIKGDIAIVAEKGDKLTMPVEAYTLKEKPVSIDYGKAMLFLRSRGYEVETPESAQAFMDRLEKKEKLGFLKELSEFDGSGAQSGRSE